jgi:hypothetical protein
MVGHMVLVHGIEVRVLVSQPTRAKLSRTRRVDNQQRSIPKIAYLLRAVSRYKRHRLPVLFVFYGIYC